MQEHFLDGERGVTVAGVIVAGKANIKRAVAAFPEMDVRMRKAIIATVDISTEGEVNAKK